MANVCSRLSSQLPTSTVIIFDSMRSLHKLPEVRALVKLHVFQFGLLEVRDSDNKHTPSYTVRFRNCHPPAAYHPETVHALTHASPTCGPRQYLYITYIL